MKPRYKVLKIPRLTSTGKCRDAFKIIDSGPNNHAEGDSSYFIAKIDKEVADAS